MKVRDVMTRSVRSVSPQTPYKEIVQQLVEYDISALPVVDAGGTLVGIVTEADLIAKGAYDGRRPRALAVLADLVSAREHPWVIKSTGLVCADVMSTNVIVCDEDEDLGRAARTMLHRGVKRMPVVHNGALVGIVSRADLLRMFTRSDDEITEDVARALELDPNRPTERQIACSVNDGIVTLRGEVLYDWDRAVVLALARGVSGVVDVVDHLHSRESNPTMHAAATTL